MAVWVVLTTVSGAKAAERLARALVQAKLAACVSVVPGVSSHYRWKRRLERSRESLLVIKTTQKLWPKTRMFLQKNHPYELPEILALPVSKGSREYLSWVERSLR